MNSTTPINDAAPWDRVHLISDYYDVPLIGVADFQGQPHVFLVHDEVFIKDEDSPADDPDFDRFFIYALHSVPEDLIEALQEKHTIFERWHKAMAINAAMQSHHPAMPDERARYEELKSRTDAALHALREADPSHLMVGSFMSGAYPVEEGASRWTSFQVRWTAVPSD